MSPYAFELSSRHFSLARKPIAFLLTFLFWLVPSLLAAQTYDVVLHRGHLMDPESGLDAIRDVGITGSRITAISTARLQGRVEVDAAGLVVAPGFIDLHQHGQDLENYRYKAPVTRDNQRNRKQ
jgi:N-acyl-D-glutamate deacylase